MDKIQVDEMLFEFDESILENARNAFETKYPNEGSRAANDFIAELCAVSTAVYITYGVEKTKEMFSRLYAALEYELLANHWRIIPMCAETPDGFKPLGCFYTMAYKYTWDDTQALTNEPVDIGSTINAKLVQPFIESRKILVNGNPVNVNLGGFTIVEGLSHQGGNGINLKALFTPILDVIAQDFVLFENTEDKTDSARRAYKELCKLVRPLWERWQKENEE